MLSVAPDDAERAVKVVGARPDVSGVGAFSWMPSTPREANGPGSEQIGIYAALGPGFGDTVFRPMIERGRHADSTRADEITINGALADLTGLDVGDETVLVGLGPDADQPATVVGIHRSALDVGPNGGAPGALGTPAFMARWWPYIQQFDEAEFLRPSIAVRIAPGAEVEDVMAEVAEMLPDAGADHARGAQRRRRAGLQHPGNGVPRARRRLGGGRHGPGHPARQPAAAGAARRAGGARRHRHDEGGALARDRTPCSARGGRRHARRPACRHARVAARAHRLHGGRGPDRGDLGRWAAAGRSDRRVAGDPGGGCRDRELVGERLPGAPWYTAAAAGGVRARGGPVGGRRGGPRDRDRWHDDLGAPTRAVDAGRRDGWYSGCRRRGDLGDERELARR